MKEFVALGLGLLMPLVVSWLKDCGWPDWAKVLLSLGLSIVGGALSALVDGALDPQSLAYSSLIVFASATTFYKVWFENTGVNGRLEQSHPLGRPTNPAVPATQIAKPAIEK
jgi:hypothetical protein